MIPGVTAFIASELLRLNQQGPGVVKLPLVKPFTDHRFSQILFHASKSSYKRFFESICNCVYEIAYSPIEITFVLISF